MNPMLKVTAVTVSCSFIAAGSARIDAYPSVYPTGTTIYEPDKTWSGYTIFSASGEDAAVLIDMNGNEVHRWDGVGYEPSTMRVLPGGYVMGGQTRRPPWQEALALVQLDWDGNEVWRFDRLEQVRYYEDPDDEEAEGEIVWGARIHHDWQREGSPVGYYSPGARPMTDGGKTLLLAHKTVINQAISDRPLGDDYVYEVSWDGEILWDWLASDHYDEMGLTEDMRNTIHRAARFNDERGSLDWAHINSASYIGPNRWFDEGDERFHPDNIIVSIRWPNVIAIADRSGRVVWRLGPDYRMSETWSEIGQIIGQHHPHIIPEGLPGAGNLLVFDNGGESGYGFANPAAPDGERSVRRSSSRVVEINPVTYEKVWEYAVGGNQGYRFFSRYVSMAQRLPNGNTMITSGATGRLFEVTPEMEIVWEYISPYTTENSTVNNVIYRAHRIPYDWVPQLDRPEETPVTPPEGMDFRATMPGDDD